METETATRPDQMNLFWVPLLVEDIAFHSHSESPDISALPHSLSHQPAKKTNSNKLCMDYGQQLFASHCNSQHRTTEGMNREDNWLDCGIELGIGLEIVIGMNETTLGY